MGIEKKKSTSGKKMYYVRIRMKGHPEIMEGGFELLTEAREKERQLKADIKRGIHFPENRVTKVTMAEILDRYEQEIIPRKAPTNKNTERQRIVWWKNRIGSLFANNISTPDIQAAVDELARKRPATRGGTVLSPNTIRKYLILLSHVFEMGIKWGIAVANPVKKVDRPPVGKGRERFLSREELDRLLEAAQYSKNPYLHAMILLAVSTGIRRGELLRLTWEDVDLQKGHLRLMNTKTKEHRGIPLKHMALQELRAIWLSSTKDSSYIFPRKDGSANRDLTKAFHNALERAHIKDFSFHDLRHTAASYLVMSGASLSDVAAILGHKTLQMVKRYAHLSSDHLAEALNRMNVSLLGETQAD